MKAIFSTLFASMLVALSCAAESGLLRSSASASDRDSDTTAPPHSTVTDAESFKFETNLTGFTGRPTLRSDVLNDNFHVHFKVLPWLHASDQKSIVFSNLQMIPGGSGCGKGNVKCSCKLQSGNVQQGNSFVYFEMVGTGTSGLATGLKFTCKFDIISGPNGAAQNCELVVDIPLVGGNTFELLYCDHYAMHSIPGEKGHVFKDVGLFITPGLADH